ncbi:MAG: glycosyltransferase family protein, partial [Chloroflexota bacterium]
EYPSAAVIHTDAHRTDENGTRLNLYSSLWQHMPAPGGHRAVGELYEGSYILTNAAVVNRRHFRRLLGRSYVFESTLPYTGDYDLWLQLLTRGGDAYYVDSPLASYRRHAAAMTTGKTRVIRLREEVVIFRDRLAGICPPALEGVRLEALRTRLAWLGFALLEKGEGDEARAVLAEAQRAGGADSPSRLDIPVAKSIAALPIHAGTRAAVWRLALAVSRGLGRGRVFSEATT